MTAGAGAPGVVVVGGGIVGCAAARALARRGREVLVVEPDTEAREASWAAAGMLTPLAEPAPGPFLDLLLAARALFPALARDLEEESGIAVGYETSGTVVAALTAADIAALEARAAWQEARGLPVRRLASAELRAMEPAITEAATSGLHYPEDHQADSRQLARALRAAARSAGARFRSGVRVRAVRCESGRASGVELDSGECIAAGTVVLAAGAWSSTIGGLPGALPVRPVHGQVAALRVEEGRFHRVLRSLRVYLVPRGGDRVLVGATAEEIGFRKEVSQERVDRLRAAASELVPELADAPLLESWSGLRPGTPDDHPVIGPDPALEGLVHATGHFRHGVLLGALTGELVAEVVDGAEPSLDLGPFSVARFR